MSTTMKSTVPILQKAMKNMDSMGIGNNIAQFEKVFEDMDVKTSEIDAAMENVYSTTISQDEVSSLLSEIQGENALATGSDMVGAGKGQIGSAQKDADVNDMQAKLDQLKDL
uniref:Uncharacterized protein n=1 Tax=Strombidium inclinatum TaxID=197538 RepID=A0A7S3IVG7_9SPIT|mmetsp:Transcript_38410/g.58485  ORF Transcript_38410/g.58485 Transcript_38410/m.58485 type:complete len:112 (+) Transcript_38410:278-613(+)